MSLHISLVQQLDQQKAETWEVRFSLHGKRLISSDGKALYLWQRDENGKWEYERSLPFPQAALPCFAPDGKILAFGDQEKLIRLVSLEGKEIAALPHPSPVNCAFSPDQHWLVSGDADRNILLWDLRTYEYFPIPIPFPAFKGRPSNNETADCFCFTPDGQRLVFGASSQEGYVQVCHVDPEQKRLTRQKTLPIDGMIGQVIAPNGKLLAIVQQDEISVYDLESFQLLQTFPPQTEARYDLLAFSPDSQFLASSNSEGMVDIWSLSTFEHAISFAAHPGLITYWTEPIGGLDWSRTGFLVTGGAGSFEKDEHLKDFTIKIWKVEY